MNIIEFAERYGHYFDCVKAEWCVGIELQPYEKDFLENLVEHRFTANLVSRQMNITTLLSVYAAYSLIFGIKERLVYMSPKMDNSKHFIEKVRQVLNNYAHLTSNKILYKENNKLRITLESENILVGVTSSADAVRRFSITKIIIDSAAYINNFDTIFSAMLQTITLRNSSFHLVSQPNGLDAFHQIYINENQFTKKMYHYSLNTKRYSSENINHLKKNIDDLTWRQEMELEFIAPMVNNVDKLIQCRVSNDIYGKIGKRLIELDISLSNYIRQLIDNDLKK